MSWGHPSVPFLTAAIAALFLYRLLATGLGFTDHQIFSVGLSGAVAVLLAIYLKGFAGQPSRD